MITNNNNIEFLCYLSVLKNNLLIEENIYKANIQEKLLEKLKIVLDNL